MTHAPTPILRATTAICAVLALGSTPAWAQEVEPAIDVPAASAPARAQPTITLPTQAPASAPAAAPPAMVSQPMIQQTPVATPPAAAIAAEEAAPARGVVERNASRTAPASAPAARDTPARPAAAPATPVATPVTAEAPLSPAASAPLAQPATPPPPADTSLQNGPQEGAQTVGDDSATAAVGAGAALLAALGLGAFAITRRRRRRVETHEDAVLTAPATIYAEPAPRPVVQRPVSAAATAQPAPAMPLDARRSIGEEELVPATHAAASRPAVSLDGPVPQTRAERDILLDRMVSAAPDASNPFTSRKARLRRARIILQSREIDAKNAETKPFDWRTYKSPTSNPAPATPPRVTA